MNDETKPKVPFNLEKFKAGQKALTREGHVATFVGICEKCENFHRLLVLIEGDDQVTSYSLKGEMHNCIGTYSVSRYDLVSMVSRHQSLIDSYDPRHAFFGCHRYGSRHQSLIDSYDPEDTWQFSINTYDKWFDVEGKPEWEENREFRIHPHNDLIKAWKKGAKIEVRHNGKDWQDASSDDLRSWYEKAEYRIKPEPVIHCLAYSLEAIKPSDSFINGREYTNAIDVIVTEKTEALERGLKIIQEWEV